MLEQQGGHASTAERGRHPAPSPPLSHPTHYPHAPCPRNPSGIIQLAPNVVLLSTFVRHLERVLPLPPVSIPAIFLVGSWCGAVADANLNVYYVTSGATAGVAALLGERAGWWGVANEGDIGRWDWGW